MRDVLAAISIARSLHRNANPLGHKMKGFAPLHDQGRPRMMREDEYRRVIHRIVSPPTSPALVEPRPPHRSKHIPAHDPGAKIEKPARGKGFVLAISERWKEPEERYRE
jgi:hypothetical protein